MTINRLIGLSGPAGSGKDTVSRFLEPYGYSPVAFADPVKRGLSEMLGIPLGHFYDPELKNQEIPWLGRSPRYLMQTLGTEWGRRRVSSDLWIRVAARKVDAILSDGGIVVVTDVRFQNEADWVRSNGGVIWHISRPGLVRGEHESEAGVDVRPIDVVIENAGSLPDLGGVVNRLIKRGD